MVFVDCGKTQDCELKLNGECFDGGLHLLGDFGKIRSRFYVFKVAWERDLQNCVHVEILAGKGVDTWSREPSTISIKIKGAMVKSKEDTFISVI